MSTATNTQKPSIIFVPGAWHTPESFEDVATILRSEGYTYSGIEKPSTSNDAPYVQSIQPDVDAVRTSIIQEVDAGNDVVVVMHSYGGIPGSSATKGLSKNERALEGKQGGVVHMIYMTAFAIDEGASLSTLGGGKLSDWCIIEGESSYARPENPQEVFYNDIPKEIADKWSAKLKHQATQTFFTPSSYAAWKFIPSTYIQCDMDNAIPFFAQELFVNQEGAKFAVEKLHSSHSPFLSMPKTIADMIRKAAGEKL